MAERDFSIRNLGPRSIKSPIALSTVYGDSLANYVTDEEFILYEIEANPDRPGKVYTRSELLERAGPREKIYFNPGHTHAAIVTCGGLCPGLNDVIRAIVLCLWYRYGVKRITGIMNGIRGFLPEFNIPTMELNPTVVDDIHTKGGTILGSSRGQGHRSSEIADELERMNINVLFVIGGDGTQKAALGLSQELQSRNLKIAIVGIPKTIDNDLSYIQKSFGFETAVAKAVEAVAAAHVEASGAINGIGLVKVMGRESGFIAAHTTLAMNDVNFTLIPEIPFELKGANGLLALLRQRLESNGHAVILVAEGAGQNLLEEIDETDASGNKVLSDIGLYLKNQIDAYFKEVNVPASVKYIDPSYMIRATPAHPADSIYCSRLGAHAAHAGMAGKTEVLISLVNNTFVHLPMKTAVEKRNQVDPEGPLWRDVLEVTRQPIRMTND
ncbi:MAG: ATP-dependent 6-phosphofructokinase [Spirochaetales bacterium]|nr:ATP-dependent 6-phosphofructokinase [Spirochaetales bacterium]